MKKHIFILISICSCLIIGCASDSTNSLKSDSVARIKPTTLANPEERLCARFAENISYSYAVNTGFNDALWEIELDEGIYLSEWEDQNGIYYRAPEGGISFKRFKVTSSGKELVDQASQNGGVWVPKQGNMAPRIYTYVSYVPAKKSERDKALDCSGLYFSNSTDQQRINLFSVAAGGAIGGVSAKAMRPNALPSYGQAALAGAVSGVIVGYLINMDIGKIVVRPEITDQDFVSKIKYNFRSPVVISSAKTVVN